MQAGASLNQKRIGIMLILLSEMKANSWSFIPEIQSADHVGKIVNQ